MKKLVLATALTLVLSACSNSAKVEKQVITKEQLVGAGAWVCSMKYDDIKVRALDISEFKPNGEMKNLGEVMDYNFEPVKFTYKTEDQGRWELNGNQLILDYDLDKRKVTKTTPKEFLAFLKKDKSATSKAFAKYEQGVFNILSSKDKGEDSKITLALLKFENDRIAIQQSMGEKTYKGGCVTAAKAEAYIEMLLKDKTKNR